MNTIANALASEKDDATLLSAVAASDSTCVPCSDSDAEEVVDSHTGKTKTCCPPTTELTLHLHRPWFDAIALGFKTYEYRECTPYWTKRIHNRQYDTVRFINGYGTTFPTMVRQYLGCDVHTENDRSFYRLKLGPLLHVTNYHIPDTLPSKQECVDVNQCWGVKDHRQCLQYCREQKVWLPRAYEPQLQIEPHIQRQPARRVCCPCPPSAT